MSSSQLHVQKVYNQRTYDSKELSVVGGQFRDICSALKKIVFEQLLSPKYDATTCPDFVLDLACGQGCDTKKILFWRPKQTQYVGVDYSETALSVAKSRNPIQNYVLANLNDTKQSWTRIVTSQQQPPRELMLVCCNAIHYLDWELFWTRARLVGPKSMLLWYVDAAYLDENLALFENHPWFQMKQTKTKDSYLVKLPGVLSDYVEERKVYPSQIKDVCERLWGKYRVIIQQHSLYDCLCMFRKHPLLSSFFVGNSIDPAVLTLCKLYKTCIVKFIYSYSVFVHQINWGYSQTDFYTIS